MNAEGRRISVSCVRENRTHSLMKGKVGIYFPTDLLYYIKKKSSFFSWRSFSTINVVIFIVHKSYKNVILRKFKY